MIKFLLGFSCLRSGPDLKVLLLLLLICLLHWTPATLLSSDELTIFSFQGKKRKTEHSLVNGFGIWQEGKKFQVLFVVWQRFPL